MLCWLRDHFVYVDANCENCLLMAEYCYRDEMIRYFSKTSCFHVLR